MVIWLISKKKNFFFFFISNIEKIYLFIYYKLMQKEREVKERRKQKRDNH